MRLDSIERLDWTDIYNDIGRWLDDYRRSPSSGSIWTSQEAEDSGFGTLTYEELTQLSFEELFEIPFVATLVIGRAIAMSSLQRSAQLLDDAIVVLFDQSVSREAPQILVRSALEGLAICWWLIDPSLQHDERLRRTNLQLFRSLGYLGRLSRSAPRVEDRPRASDVTSKLQRDLVDQASTLGWKCDDGKTPNVRRWKDEIPGYESLVERLITLEEPNGSVHIDGRFVYGMLSGQAHSDFIHIVLGVTGSANFRHNAMIFLGNAIYQFFRCLLSLSHVMGWNDHAIPEWFSPILLYFSGVREAGAD